MSCRVSGVAVAGYNDLTDEAACRRLLADSLLRIFIYSYVVLWCLITCVALKIACYSCLHHLINLVRRLRLIAQLLLLHGLHRANPTHFPVVVAPCTCIQVAALRGFFLFDG